MPVKIIDLSSEDAATSDDLIIIRDNLTNTTRKITIADLFTNPPISAGSITEDMYADGSIPKRALGPDAKPQVRSYNQPSPSTLTPDMDDYDMFIVTALAGGMTIAPPTTDNEDGFVNGQPILFRFKDNGSAQSLSWNAIWRPIGVTLPTATVGGKLLYLSARYNAESVKWDVISVGREG